ncbi:hypothetical protein ACFQ3Z_04200 [Streptomyces nogalater]
MSVQNAPISYDFHGDIPFSTPFKDIKPDDIHIYLDLDTKVGKNTCGQKCAHCWFVNYEKVYDKSFAMEEAPASWRACGRTGTTSTRATWTASPTTASS